MRHMRPPDGQWCPLRRALVQCNGRAQLVVIRFALVKCDRRSQRGAFRRTLVQCNGRSQLVVIRFALVKFDRRSQLLYCVVLYYVM